MKGHTELRYITAPAFFEVAFVLFGAIALVFEAVAFVHDSKWNEYVDANRAEDPCSLNNGIGGRSLTFRDNKMDIQEVYRKIFRKHEKNYNLTALHRSQYLEGVYMTLQILSTIIVCIHLIIGCTTYWRKLRSEYNAVVHIMAICVTVISIFIITTSRHAIMKEYKTVSKDFDERSDCLKLVNCSYYAYPRFKSYQFYEPRQDEDVFAQLKDPRICSNNIFKLIATALTGGQAIASFLLLITAQNLVLINDVELQEEDRRKTKFRYDKTVTVQMERGLAVAKRKADKAELRIDTTEKTERARARAEHKAAIKGWKAAEKKQKVEADKREWEKFEYNKFEY